MGRKKSPRERLREWVAGFERVADAAERLGCNRSTLQNVLDERRAPSKWLRLSIEVNAGCVMAGEWGE